MACGSTPSRGGPGERSSTSGANRTLAPGWPGDGSTVAATRAAPGRLPDVGVDAVTDSYAHVVQNLPEAPYEDRGHSAPLDHGWRELADATLAWIDDHGLKP